ncbi:peptidase C60 sortase A and B [Patulibacter medicamentivorans]|uniref:Peptidase C60 sortase A and B n=1 Tax=Patulibacter medicamentivorans TaxID=1097667 RepID=H0EB54_9ACTN|nr:class F sortase [Patulibacter medicamentivorans]EHN09129.1 peptidase C60 sortase A and B [Patulibacter medicamentivorans]
MRRPLWLSPLLVLISLAALPQAASAAEPPNQHDPCASGGRNTCGTTGVGKYDRYRYGTRWFGDFRGAIDGVSAGAFCIDLRFWYPSKRFAYEKRPIAGLKSKERKSISAAKLRQMAYALWNFGRSRQRNQQAAVMLYVHGLMDDGAPGEVDPKAIGVSSLYARIARDARRYAGPYRVQVDLPSSGLTVGTAIKPTVRVLASSGAVVPNATVDLSGSAGATGLPRTISTGRTGVARLALTPSDAKGGLRLSARATGLAAAEPDLYVPTRGASARSGQRLVVPATASVATERAVPVAPARIKVTTAATPTSVLLGTQSTDKVTISGAPAGWSAPIAVRLYGPAPSQAAIRCDGPPAAEVTHRAGGGDSITPPVTPSAPGWYGYQLVVPGSDDVIGTTTPCAEPSESLRVEVQPRVHTQISNQLLNGPGSVTDTVWIEGLSGQPATVAAALYGPLPAADKLTCDGPPVWSGSFAAATDGQYVTDPVQLSVPGYYTYRERLTGSEFVRVTDTACGDAAETTIVRGHPQITTQISSQDTAVGSEVTDTAVVTGLGKLRADVAVELWGPFPSRDAIRCEGTPYWTGTFPADGDGSYRTAPVKLQKAGYYTYREAITGSTAYDGVQTACGEAAETTIARAKPQVTTVVSSAVTRPGSSISDRIKVTGLGQTPARVEVELFGPFASRGQIRCGGTPYWKGAVDVAGDGEVSSPSVRLAKAGFYTYRERIAGSESVTGTETACAEEAETSLGRPLILTGRGEGERVAEVRATAAPGAVAPTQVRLDRLGVRASLGAVAIDLGTGALAVPKDIKRAGWWADGADLASKAGTVLLAGHVDSAKRGAGAFFRLKSARRGDTVTVSGGGRTQRYRVTSVTRVAKERLPVGIFTRTGSRRLVLVTCGGPFDRRSGHYRDNILVTAVPR